MTISNINLSITICFLNKAGVIDKDYRGNVGVILFNFGESSFIGKIYLTLVCFCFFI